MATPSDFASETATAVANLESPALQRLRSDYRDDLERVAPGQTRFQVRTSAAGFDGERSNSRRPRVGALVRIHHHLADPQNERAFTEGPRLDYLSSLMAEGWWRDLGSVSSLTEAPQETTSREGNVVTIDVELVALLKP